MLTAIASLGIGWHFGLGATLLIAMGFAGLGLVVGTVLLGRRRSSPTDQARPPIGSEAKRNTACPPTLPAAPSSGSKASAEHRETIRTCGTWVRIVLKDQEDATGQLLEAHVIDFTANGVGLVLFQPLPVGKALRARHAKAPGNVPWVELEVRSCHQLEKTVWKVGCHVQDVTLWDTLMRYS